MVYSYTPENPSKVAKSKGSYLRTHFKNTREVASVLRGMKLSRAYSFLNDVKAHKQCVPFRRFAGSTGRTAQAKAWGTSKGRWPVKSVEFVLGLLENAESNAKVSCVKRQEIARIA